MERAMFYGELLPHDIGWDDFILGDAPFLRARAMPDVWIPVFELTAKEALTIAFGGTVYRLRYAPLTILYDSATDAYCFYPLRLIARKARLTMMPQAWRDIWSPLLSWFFFPLRAVARWRFAR